MPYPTYEGANHPGQNNWPEDIKEALDLLLVTLSPEALTRLRSTAKDDLYLFHYGLGTHIRNNCGLWRGNEKLIASACSVQGDPDDASMRIIEALWQRLQDRP